ncbi:hypothetical protein BLNAU_14438 [Blattamonas nauphoetae]|uniref:Uncharacterized protein n=1 Tax=Blattamonas nauphoetae TaxID=2049346 RepID=A0ABQ9XDS6_9EUKA|nr:hypothetical protein BLNAU_14438 [Blattamonas nauphoetae]
MVRQPTRIQTLDAFLKTATKDFSVSGGILVQQICKVKREHSTGDTTAMGKEETLSPPTPRKTMEILSDDDSALSAQM